MDIICVLYHIVQRIHILCVNQSKAPTSQLNQAFHTGSPRSYRKHILQITQPSQYRYAKLQYRFAVTSGSTSKYHGYFRSWGREGVP